VSTDTRSRADQCRDLLFRQIFAASISRVRLTNRNFPIFDGGVRSRDLNPQIYSWQNPIFPYMAYYTESLLDGDHKTMANKSERLTVLSDAEQFALYGRPTSTTGSG